MASTLNCQLKIDVQPRYAFDLRHECASNLRFLSPSCIVFPVGRHLAVQRLDALQQASELGSASSARPGSSTGRGSRGFVPAVGLGPNGGAGGQHLQQSMGFLMRLLSPAASEEGGQAATAAQFQQEHKEDGQGPNSSPRHQHTESASGSSSSYSYLIGTHWTTQSMSRLRLGERDWLSRHESHLLSCFAPHPQRKQILTAEHSTELRVVTVSVADVHQACTEDFTQLSLRRFRLNFIVLPCVQQLTSDKGRREARDRRERHERRKKKLRRVARLKAARARLEEQRLQELSDSVALANLMGPRAAHDSSGAGGEPPSPPRERSDVAAIVPSSVVEELRALKCQLDEAEAEVAQMEPRSDGEPDSDFEGYDSADLRSEEEGEEGGDDAKRGDSDDEREAARAAAHARFASTGGPLSPIAAAAQSTRVSFAPDLPASSPSHQRYDSRDPAAAAAAMRAAQAAAPHHHMPTESWSNRVRDVRRVDSLGTRGVAASWRAHSEALALAAEGGFALPEVGDPAKEELVFCRIVCAEWSADGKYAVLVGDGPKHPLMVWEVSSQLLVGAQRFVHTAVTRAAFLPVPGPLTVVTLGPGHLRVWEVKVKQSEHHHTYTCPVHLGEGEREAFVDFAFLRHLRTAGNMAVLTTARVHIVSQGKVVSVVALDANGALPSAAVPRCIAATARGFAVALDGQVLLHEFRAATTSFLGAAAVRDEAGSDRLASERRRADEARQQQLIAAHAPAPEQTREEKEQAKLQGSLLERFRNLAPASQQQQKQQKQQQLQQQQQPRSARGDSKSGNSASGGGGSTGDSGRSSKSGHGHAHRETDNFDLFPARSVPLFRPLPGVPPPPPESVPALLAAGYAALAAAAAAASAASSSDATQPPTAAGHSSSAASSPSSSPSAAAGQLFQVHSMVCSPDECSLLLSSRTRDVVLLSLEDVAVCSEGEEASCVSSVGSNLHDGPVTDAAVCAEQPLIVSCSSASRTVRLHNYLDRTCELLHRFESAPISIAIHPGATEIAVAFPLTLGTFRVLPGELQPRGEFSLPSAGHLCYSHGGSYLAAVSGGKQLVVVAGSTCKTVARHHTGEAVTALAWGADDTSVFTAGVGGHVYEWGLHGAQGRLREFVAYDTSFSSIAVSALGQVVVAGVARAHHAGRFTLHEHTPAAATAVAARGSSSSAAAAGGGQGPNAYAGALHYVHYPMPDEFAQQQLGVGSGAHSEQKSMGLYTAPPNSKDKARAAVSDPEFNAAYAYVGAQGAAAAAAPGGSDGGPVAAKPGEEFVKIEVEARPALPVASSYSRQAIAAEARETAAAAAALATSSRSARSAHASAAATALAATATAAPKRSRSSPAPCPSPSTYASPLLEALRSPSFPAALASPFQAHYPPHARVAHIQMGRVWFLVIGTHRGSLELYRAPVSRYPVALAEVSLHSEPVVSLLVCQKMGVVVSTSLDGSIFVSSLCMTPHASSASPSPSPEAKSFPTYSCMVPNFYKHNLFACISLAEYSGLYPDQKESLRVEHEVHERYRRMVEKRFFGGVRNAEDEEALAGQAVLLQRKQAFLENEASLRSLRAGRQEVDSAWQFKMCRDQFTLGKKLRDVEENFKKELLVHLEEKKRLQEADVAREREKQEGFAQSDRAHQDAIAELERVYERKLGQEAVRNRAHRVQFQDLNMKLANELLLAKRHFAEEVAQLRAQFDREQAAHGADRKDLSGKLQLVEAEAIAMLEEQDEEHDHERQKNQNEHASVVSGLSSSFTTAQQDAQRLKVELGGVKFRNKNLADQVGEWKARHNEAVKESEQREGQLRREQIARQALEAELASRDAQASVLQAACERLEGQRLALREQVAALLAKAELNDVPRAKLEFETVVRELDGEFAEKALQIKIAKKELHDKTTRLAVLSKENASLQSSHSEAQQLLDRLREDLVKFKDIRALREKYAEFTSAPAGPQTFRRRIEHEFSRQLQFYTHTTSALQAKLSQAEAAIASSNERRISENIHVMRQVNDLRHRNLEYKNEVMQVNSDLNAIKLRERIRRLAKNGPAAGGGAGGAGAGIHREPLHTPRNPVLSATKHTARFLARYVDEDMGVDGLVSGVEPGESGARALVDPALTRAFDRQVVHKHAGPATPVDLSQGRRAHRHDEGDDGSGGGEGQEEEGQGPDTPSNRALLHEQVSLVKQMKEESEHMLLNSYRRINEQDQEIAMLRQENEKLMMHLAHGEQSSAATASSSGLTTPATVLRPTAPQSATSNADQRAADHMDSVLHQATKRRMEASSSIPASHRVRPHSAVDLAPSTSNFISPHPPLSARYASPSPAAAAVSGSQTARGAPPSHSVSARNDVPKVTVPKRWQQVQPPLPPPTSALPFAPSARAAAVIAQAKQARPATSHAGSLSAQSQRRSSQDMAAAASGSGAAATTAQFDTASLFRDAVAAAASEFEDY